MTEKVKHFTVLLALLTFSLTGLRAADIWVSPNGPADGTGTRDSPLNNVHLALRKARELRRLSDPSIKGGINIILRGGLYTFDEPLFLRPEDSGTPASPTIIKAADGETPVISGGIRVRSWKKAGNIKGLPRAANGQVWVADAPAIWDNVLDFRQLWVNNSKAVRARDTKPGTMSRILSWNHQEQSCQIPKPSQDISNVLGLEMFIHQWWAIAVLRVKDVQVKGDSAKLTFYQPESRVQSEHPWPAPWLSKKTGNSAFYLSNAVQFLDQPGEWYLDKKNRKLYYWPRKNENLNSADVRVPYLETLVRVKGTIDKPVSYISFKGISFQHTGWLRPSQAGHVPLQAGLYLLDAYKLKIPGTPEKKGLENQGWVGRPPAAFEAAYVSHTTIENCRFEHLASSGVDYQRSANLDTIRGNVFKDVGGTGIQAGVFSDESFESHLAYNPADGRELVRNTTISNNLITDVTNEDWGCLGISAGFVKGINISHNDISEVSYSGISVGWGWTKTVNAMSDNHIEANKIVRYARHMYDVAGVYTLSAQPGSSIERNYVDSIYTAPYAHDPYHWFYLYTDEGSSYFNVKDNWCPAEKFLQNANGPGNVWENNGPMAHDSVKYTAGLEQKYRYLLKDRAGYGNSQPINTYAPDDINVVKSKPVVLEVSLNEDALQDSSAVLALLKKNNIPSSLVYSWKNHFAVVGNLDHPDQLQDELRKKFPKANVKLYEKPFYSFSRTRNCGAAKQAEQWDNIVLTANLVKDPALQQEYMNFHASQFEKWPEVSKGFCSADFQQLLLFRNERQLMLIISVPKGKSLAELDPKTVENNPRVVEWNSIMKKYQEGIPGIAKGETWVFMK